MQSTLYRQHFTDAQHAALSAIADFGHVFQVVDGGGVFDLDAMLPPHVNSPASHLYAPEALDPDPEATTLDGWQLPLSGLTGQHGYKGPWLHDSELIEGGVAERVLSLPGYWVAIYAQHFCGPEIHPQFADLTDEQNAAARDGDHDDCETYIEGWTMAHIPFPDLNPNT